MRLTWTTIGGAVALLTMVATTAMAQVPVHQPGTICYTPNFWCWLNPPQPPGTQCVCASPYGPYTGTAG